MNSKVVCSSALGYSESSWSVLALTRFCLAVVVYTVHLPWFVPPQARWDGILSLGGKAAVIGFLFISGVSIGHSLATQPEGYFQRRFLRIYPLYLAAVTFTAILTLAIGQRYEAGQTVWVAAHWKTTLANFLMLQGFATIPMSCNLPLWTISIEVFFYLLAPSLRKAPLWSLILLILVSMSVLAFTHKLWNFGYPALRFAWPWVMGFILATRGYRWLIALLAAPGAMAIKLNHADTGQRWSWLTFLAVVAIVYVAGRARLPAIAQKVFNFLGEQSYPLYLFHFPMCLALIKCTGIRNVWAFSGAVFGTVIVVEHVFDHWLKAVFWKPLVRSVTAWFGNSRFGRVEVLAQGGTLVESLPES